MVLFSINLFVCLFVYLFICFFVSLSARLRENGLTDLHDIFREGACEVTMGRRDSILGQFGETARCRDANFFVSICQHYQQSALLAVMSCHLATENVMNFATSQHGGGVCCAFVPQLVIIITIIL